MEETKRKAGRPPKISTEEVEINKGVSVEIPKQELNSDKKATKKTVLEYLAEFENKKVLEVPEILRKRYPEMHFVWMNNDERRISPKEGMGYELVHCPELAAKKLGVKGYRNITDDLVKYGDLVLMMVPEEYYQAREMKKELDLQKRAGQLAKSTKLHEAVATSGLNLPITSKLEQTRG